MKVLFALSNSYGVFVVVRARSGETWIPVLLLINELGVQRTVLQHEPETFKEFSGMVWLTIAQRMYEQLDEDVEENIMRMVQSSLYSGLRSYMPSPTKVTSKPANDAEDHSRYDYE